MDIKHKNKFHIGPQDDVERKYVLIMVDFIVEQEKIIASASSEGIDLNSPAMRDKIKVAYLDNLAPRFKERMEKLQANEKETPQGKNKRAKGK